LRNHQLGRADDEHGGRNDGKPYTRQSRRQM
jgi:hypothetical protein